MTTPRLSSGILVAFEGIDGAGKTTQAALLGETLLRSGFRVVSSKEPTSGVHGQRLRRSATEGRMSPAEELATFEADRREHVERLIRPSLESGAIVVVDRYYFSSAAYQGARDLNVADILASNETFAPRPDLTFLLDISPAVAMERIAARGDASNLFERKDSLARSAEIFRSIQNHGIVHVKGTESREVIHAQVLKTIDEGPLFRRFCLRLPLPACEPVYCSHRIEGRCKYPEVSLPTRASGLDVDALNALASRADLTPEEQVAEAARLLRPSSAA